MAKWNTTFKERKEIIAVVEITKKRHNYYNPVIEFIDQKGREHWVSQSELHCSDWEWEQIEGGALIEYTIREKVTATRLMRLKNAAGTGLPDGDYVCSCTKCKKLYGVDETPDIKNTIQKIIDIHTNLSPGCSHKNLKIFRKEDESLREQTELEERIIAFLPAKTT